MDELPMLVKLINAPIEQMSKEELVAHIARLQELQRKDLGQAIEDDALGKPEYGGFLYVLSNKSMPGIVKIGVTTGRVEKRAKELSRPTGVPQPFVIECYFPVYDVPRRVERFVHDQLTRRGLRPGEM
jgi:hypothetical protein